MTSTNGIHSAGQVGHCDDAERHVLGAMLLHPECVPDVTPIVRVVDFYLPKHQQIFAALVTVHQSTGQSDPIRVGHELGHQGLNEVGGPEYLMDLLEGVITAADVAGYARIVREHADRRRLAAQLQDQLDAVSSGGDLDRVRTALVEMAFAPTQRKRDTFDLDLTEAMDESWVNAPPDPPRWLLRHPDRAGVACDDREGDGLLRQGKVGILTSAGGVGKTMVLLELAISIVTRRKWLGHFDVDQQASGDVVMLLAEEDGEECHRRLWNTMEALGLGDAERDEVRRRVKVLGLAGNHVALAEQAPTGPQETHNMHAFLRALRKLDDVALVCIDPLSRFAGVSVDGDNEAATFVVQLLEQFAMAANATVLVAAHSSKFSRNNGHVDVRGATSIVDSVRWVASLSACKDGNAELQLVKSNYSRPMPKPLHLVREHGGRLRVLTPDEVAELEAERGERKQAKIEKLAREMNTALAAHTKPITNQKDGMALVKGDTTVKRLAWKLATDNEWIVKIDGQYRPGKEPS